MIFVMLADIIDIQGFVDLGEAKSDSLLVGLYAKVAPQSFPLTEVGCSNFSGIGHTPTAYRISARCCGNATPGSETHKNTLPRRGSNVISGHHLVPLATRREQDGDLKLLRKLDGHAEFRTDSLEPVDDFTVVGDTLLTPPHNLLTLSLPGIDHTFMSGGRFGIG